jgi:uncharacterized protein
MKLHASVTAGLMTITAYDAGYVAVNGRKLTRSFLLTPRSLIEDWPPTSIETLSADTIARPSPRWRARSSCLAPGLASDFRRAALLRPLIERRVGVEIMDTHAACRTYNILMAEGRDVAAALIIE